MRCRVSYSSGCGVIGGKKLPVNPRDCVVWHSRVSRGQLFPVERDRLKDNRTYDVHIPDTGCSFCVCNSSAEGYEAGLNDASTESTC